jgi:hypothetical protein
MDKLNINVSDETNEIVVRQGEALKTAPPAPLRIEGTLKAPADFLLHKSGNYEAKDCHLQVMKTDGALGLCLSEKDALSSDIITGGLTLNPLIEGSFGINTENKWSITAFRQFIQKKSFFFSSNEEYTALLTKLQKFNVNVSRVYENHNDNTGNGRLLLESKVSEANVIPAFKLKLPIYLGYPEQTFSVEVGLDVTAAECKLFLYSEEVYHLMESLKNKYMDSEIKRFENLNFALSIVSIN